VLIGHVLAVRVAKDADEKERWISALENTISRQDLYQVSNFYSICFWHHHLTP